MNDQYSSDGKHVPKNALVEFEGRRLQLSNLSKPLYPTGFTKAAVIDYFRRVAPVLLPHLKGHPLTLKRYPDGALGEFFYEKNCPAHAPSWMRKAPVWSEHSARTVSYCLVDDLASLVWVANLASLELHTSLARAPRLKHPTMLVFDLDPGPPADVVACTRVALRLRALLESFSLACWAKTSGKKGLQVYVPLNTPTSYDETKPFAHAIAQLLEEERPGDVVSLMKKELRTGKVFVDWSQNDEHKTTVCVYSLRAGERPTVSTPVRWEEVEEVARSGDKEPLIFEPLDVIRRVAESGDLFEPVLSLKQKLPAEARRSRPRGVRTPKAAPPGELLEKVFPPMLATLARRFPPDEDKWLWEVKYDGFRCLAALSGGQLAMWSRNRLDLSQRFPNVAKALSKLVVAEAVFDGEVVVLDAEGSPRFALLQQGEQAEIMVCFDLLWLDGTDLRSRPLEERRDLLESVLAGAPASVRVAERVPGSAQAALEVAKARSLEGLIAKQRGSLYEGKRSKRWLKLKLVETQEVAIVGYTIMDGASDQMAALLLAVREGRKLVYAGKVGTGFTTKQRKDLLRLLMSDAVDQPEVAGAPRMKRAVFVKPRHVAEIRFADWTKDGMLRQARYEGLRDDKTPMEAVREKR